MACPGCGAENRGGKFCSECGQPLALVCPGCGAPHEATDKFCSECGTSLIAASGLTRTPSPITDAPTAVRVAPTRERRLVSVLFADLVGFTTLSENRDPEEVRDLLTRYFDTVRRIIGRYGGVVEKFIGDAVMAVWGTPVATEDDSERAVRASLELTQAVAALGEEAGAEGLRARAGVVTGEAAVNLGAEGQGMVAGDIVNTASRVQSVAPPGGVYVDVVTRRSTEAAITFDEAGSFELKGKSEPMTLWRAGQVLGGRQGALKASGLEAPFVGREREMLLIKQLFHGSAEDHRAHLVSATGIAGIGKSRLGWEFFKYIDGLAQDIWWHRGRSLSYGEGVTYWALAEMIKMRAGIQEEEAADSAVEKLRDVIALHVEDEEERRWLEPRVAHLLGLEQRGSFERDDLFAGWRLFFERMAETAPTVLVFEDIQWADSSLLDFIEYLLEWSRNHALFILTLGRPEVSDKRPNWGAGKRSFTSLFLEPLTDPCMDELLAGLVPGLPGDARARIRARAEGVPLYAVETVRMLLDKGHLKRDGDSYLVTAPVDTLEVPESLHALIAARLDALAPNERHLLQDASVAGKSFTTPALLALNPIPEPELDEVLASLVRKDLLTVQSDPRSPERGQYSFLQALVKKVAYDTFSNQERKARHLAMASFLSDGSGYDADDIVEVVSSHFIEAYRAAPHSDDAEVIKDKARLALIGAGERAASLAANEEAQRYFEQAAELTSDPVTKAQVLERAGRMAMTAGRNHEARAHFEAAIRLFDSAERSHAAARVWAHLATVMYNEGRGEVALQRLEQSFQLLVEDEPDGDLAQLALTNGIFLLFAGQAEKAAERIEFALAIAESQWLPEALSRGLNYKSLVLETRERHAEALGLMKYSLEVALENDLPSAAMGAYANIAHQMQARDRYEEAQAYRRSGLTLARRQGDRPNEWSFLTESIFTLFVTGNWDEALENAANLPDWSGLGLETLLGLTMLPNILLNRGDTQQARKVVAACRALAASSEEQDRASYALARSVLLRAEEKYLNAIGEAQEALQARESWGLHHESVKLAYIEALEAALALNDLAIVKQLLVMVESLPPGEVPPLIAAHVARFRARLAEARGELAGVETGFKSAAGLFREIGAPFYLAVTLLEHGEWLVDQGRSDEAEPLLEEAGDVFERLKALPWSERLERLRRTRTEITTGPITVSAQPNKQPAGGGS